MSGDEDRASRAQGAVNAYVEGNPDTDDGSVLHDMLTDLRHWAALNGYDFDAASTVSEVSYNEEVRQ